MSIALGARDMTQLRRWVDASAEVVQDPAASLFTKRIRELLDRPAEALAYLHEMARNPDNSALTQSVIAQYLLFFGDVDGALQLHLPGTEVSAVVLLSGWHPVNRQIRRLPRFKQWMLAGGFVDYWNAYKWADLCRQVDEADFECD